jgi:hypothetical protein
MADGPRIAIDAMGGDGGPVAMIAGASRALRKDRSLQFTFYGDEKLVAAEIAHHQNLSSAHVVHSPEAIAASEKPSQAIRRARSTSMGMAINAVKEQIADAALSGGNTGALMAMSKLALRTMPGIDRPALAALLPAPARAQARYRDSALPIEARARDLLARMTLEEKFWQLFMLPGSRADPAHDYAHGVFGLQDRAAPDARRDAEAYNALQRFFTDSTRLGIPMLAFEEGVHVVMRRGATVFPAAIALAATFDTGLVHAVAAAIAREARSRGIRQLLSPVVNIATDVRWGRVEETYGEDPFLASAMARAYTRELDREGVIATPKHFVANVGDGGRDSYPINLSTRALEQLHFPPFRAALGAGARSVMTAYNSVDGMPASQSRALLDGTLRGDWSFGGFVISDQSAVGGAVVLHRTEASTATVRVRSPSCSPRPASTAAWDRKVRVVACGAAAANMGR